MARTLFEQASRDARRLDGHSLMLQASPEAFARIEKALKSWEDELAKGKRELNQVMQHYTGWGIGEGMGVVESDGLAAHMTAKVQNGDSGALDRIEQHLIVVGHLAETFRAMRERYYSTDAGFAHRYDAALR